MFLLKQQHLPITAVLNKRKIENLARATNRLNITQLNYIYMGVASKYEVMNSVASTLAVAFGEQIRKGKKSLSGIK